MTRMTRKHFRAIAAAISEARRYAVNETSDLFTRTAALAALDRATWELADNLRHFNPRFDRDVFDAACKAEAE